MKVYFSSFLLTLLIRLDFEVANNNVHPILVGFLNMFVEFFAYVVNNNAFYGVAQITHPIAVKSLYLSAFDEETCHMNNYKCHIHMINVL